MSFDELPFNPCFYFEFNNKVNFERETDYLLRIEDEINTLTFFFNISKPEALKTYFEAGSNIEMCSNILFENNRNLNFSVNKFDASDDFEICNICLEFKEKRFSNKCEHFFCQDCYGSYIKNNLDSVGYEAIFMSCPNPDCKVYF